MAGKRLIDANVLNSELIERQYRDQTMGILHTPYPHMRAIVANQPTVDAVEVVRCKDCEVHNNCTIEEELLAAGCNNPFCPCGGRKDK